MTKSGTGSRTAARLAVAATFMAIAAPAWAHDIKVPHNHAEELVVSQVTSDAEKTQAAEMEASGPTETTGILAVKNLGAVGLEGQFDSIDGRVLRARELEIAPGGVVAVHRHDGRPGVAYIISGQMTEHRADADGPVVKQAGDTAFEENGTVHWWRNDGDTVARALVVDIVPAQ